MKKFRFYYNGLRERNAPTMAQALLDIIRAYPELGELTPRELMNKTNIIQL